MTDKQAEELVRRFAWYLLPGDIRIKLTQPAEYIEGADIKSVSILNGNGNIETKRINNFLTRGNDNNEPSGTIPLELFQNADPKQREKWYPGWLSSICNASDYTEYRKDNREKQEAQGKKLPEVKAETPGALVYVLTDERSNPFACVAFEDIPALVTRLLELCPDPEGWGLSAPKEKTKLAQEYQRRATDTQYWKQWWTWNDQRGKIINNVWHVPFREIKGYATVTLINSRPEIKTYVNQYGQTITAELQEQRYNALKEKAEERGAMGILRPKEVLEEEQKAIEKITREIGIPAENLHHVNMEKIESLYDPDKLKEIKEHWEQARQKHKEITGEELPTWEARTTRKIGE